jgi:subtilisin family serine protease
MGKVNPWLAERLPEVKSPPLNLIVETTPADEARVLQALGHVAVSIKRGSISRFPQSVFIPVVARKEDVERIAELPGVVAVHYNMPRYIRVLSRTDPLLGKYQLSRIEVPRGPGAVFQGALGLLGVPATPFVALLGKMVKEPGLEIIPTSVTRQMLGLPEDAKIGLTVGVLDTGTTPHPMFHPTKEIEYLSATGEPPFDGLGHGQWVASCAFGDSLPTRFGLIRGMSDPDVRSGGKLVSVKVLSNIGFGSSESVLQGMAWMVQRGVRIVNMSLGGPLQGSVEDDPECKVISQTPGIVWCVAAGNCLSADTLVYTNPHGAVPISRLKSGDTVFSLTKPELVRSDHGGGYQLPSRLVPQRVMRVLQNGIRPVFELTTRSRTIKVTDNHPFLRLERLGPRKYALRWTCLRDLKVGDQIVICHSLPAFTAEKSLGIRFSRLLGYFLGDGWVRLRDRGRGEVSFAAYGVWKETYRQIISDALGVEPKEDRRGLHLYSRQLAEIFVGLMGKQTAREKRLPEWVYQLPKEEAEAFLEGYIDADGHRQGNGNIALQSTNPQLIEQLHALCLALGRRVTNIYSQTKKLSIHNGYRSYDYTSTSYGFRIITKGRKSSPHFRRNRPMLLRGLARHPTIGIEAITSVTALGAEMVYDIEVEGTHNFVAAGFIVHNSGPEEWTIGSPGASPYALTFGAWSPKYDGLALFSSRGPSAEFYKDHPDIWQRDHAKYGDDLVKPDVCSYGGGPVEKGQPTDEIYSAATGWMDAIGDLSVDGLTPMRGTSMATPHGCGTVALALDRGLVRSAADVKRKMARFQRKDPHTGYGLLLWERLE